MPTLQPNPVSQLARGKSLKDLLPVLFPEVDCPLKPLGNRILVQVASPLETSGGGIIMTSETRDYQKWTQKLAKVIKVGDLAYKDRTTFQVWPEGPWCKPGDYIRVPQYGGDRVEIEVPKDISKYDGHTALFATIADRDAWSAVEEGFDPLTLKGWF